MIMEPYIGTSALCVSLAIMLIDETRWDLRMGQRGQLDKVPVAHNGPVTSLDWYAPQHLNPRVKW